MRVSVFRLEGTHANLYGMSLGPYTSDSYFRSHELNMAHNDDAHPAPIQEGIENVMPYEYHACASIDGLKDWFGEWLEDIVSEGFKVVEYVLDSEDVRFGKKQCVFDCNGILEKKCITDLVVPNSLLPLY